MCYKEIFTEYSSVPIFNKIKEYAESKGYVVVCFKTKMPSINSLNIDNMSYEWVQYIHIMDDCELVLSIYYDHWQATAPMGYSFFELYDCNDVQRSYNDKMGRNWLFRTVKYILK